MIGLHSAAVARPRACVAGGGRPAWRGVVISDAGRRDGARPRRDTARSSSTPSRSSADGTTLDHPRDERIARWDVASGQPALVRPLRRPRRDRAQPGRDSDRRRRDAASSLLLDAATGEAVAELADGRHPRRLQPTTARGSRRPTRRAASGWRTRARAPRSRGSPHSARVGRAALGAGRRAARDRHHGRHAGRLGRRLRARCHAASCAQFVADDTRAADDLSTRLAIDPDVDALAALLAARAVEPPLSVGLFGEWGSGKTFFMRRLRRRVAELASDARDSGELQKDVAWHKRIVQIEFNAWHYAEGNLWASLVEHILGNLRLADDEDEDVVAAPAACGRTADRHATADGRRRPRRRRAGAQGRQRGARHAGVRARRAGRRGPAARGRGARGAPRRSRTRC